MIEALDGRVVAWLQTLSSPTAAAMLYAITELNSLLGIAAMGTLLALHQAVRRERNWAALTVATIGGAMALNALVKLAIARPRPHFDEAWVILTTYSFPSGHTSAATAFYGVLAAYACSRTEDRRRRVAIVIAAVVAVMVVGFSRMYLGAHYLSDVVAAAAWTSMWLLLCLTLVRRKLAPHATGAS